MRVLLAVDEGDVQLFEGEPALLVAHRPFAPAELLRVEGADALVAAALDAVVSAASELAALIDAAHDRGGQFDGERLLGRRVTIAAPAGSFRLRQDA